MRIIARCLLIGLLAVAAACSSDFNEALNLDEAQNHIPENAALVLTYQPAQLMDKGGYEEALRWPVAQDLLLEAESENAYFARIMKNPAESGVDLDKRFYFVAGVDVKNIQFSPNYAYYLFSIADLDQFEKLWHEMDLPVKPGTRDRQYFSEDGEAFIAWTDTWGIAGRNKSKTAEEDLNAIIDMNAWSSLAVNRNFRKCLDKEADVALWMGSNGLAESINETGLNILANFSEKDLKDNYLHHFLHFENGQIRTESEFFIKKKIRTDLDLLFRDKVKTDFSGVLPEGNIQAVMTAALNPAGINQILIEKYAKRAVAEAANRQGLSFDDLLQALDGDIALVAYKNDSKSEGLFIAKIAKKDQLNSLLDIALDKGVLSQISEHFYAVNFEEEAGKNFKLKGKLLIKGDLIYLGASESGVLFDKIREEQFIQPGRLKDLRQLQKENIFSFFAPVFQSPWGDRIAVENVSARADRKSAEVKITLENKEENSLRQFMRTIQKETRRE